MARFEWQHATPVAADTAYDNLRAENLYGQLASSSCRHFWWHTGDFEISLGAWLMAVALVFMTFPIDGVSSVVGWLLLATSLAIPVMIPVALRGRIILPAGVCLSAPPRARAHRGLIAVAAVLYAGVAVLAVTRGDAFAPTYVVASVAALAALVAYALSGSARHFVLAAWLEIVVPFAYRYLTAAISAGALGLKANYGSAGVAKVLGLGPAMPLALAVLMVGMAIFACGLFAFVRSLRIRAASRVDGHEEQRLIIGLASGDARIRFMTAVYLCTTPVPATVVRLVYGSTDENLAIAKTMRLALTRVWGDSAEKRMDSFLAESSLKGKRAIEYTAEEWHARRDAQRTFVEDEVARRDEVARELRKQAPRGDDLRLHLIELAEHTGDADLATTAIELLGFTCEPEAYAWLASTMRDDLRTKSERRACVRAFARADASAVDYLLPLFVDRRSWVRSLALDAASELLQTLDRISGASSQAVRCRALLHDPAFTMALHPSAVTRAHALSLLASYGTEAVGALSRSCSDRAALVRASALRALSRADEFAAGQFVFDALTDERAIVRESAVFCAQNLHLIRAMNRVVVLINDPSEAVSSLANEFILISQSW